ncbi:MAG: thioesterase family protein [Chthoniobacterales bacterium]
MLATSSTTAYELSRPVLAADIDELGHVNNTVYLRWVQDAATAHWEALAAPESQLAVFWVVLRHEIDFKTPALAGDEVLLRTWVGKASRLTFERFTEIMRARDRQIFAQARTLWCPVNPATGRPTRVTPELRAQFSA